MVPGGGGDDLPGRGRSGHRSARSVVGKAGGQHGPGGDAGLQLIEAVRPDLAIVDARMPGIGGFELCRRVVAAALPTSVVLFSAFVDDVGEAHARTVGAAAIVPKERGFAPLRQQLERLRPDLGGP